MNIQPQLASLSYYHHPLSLSAIYKQRCDDFIVKEHIGFDLTGEGEHLWVYIEKRALNTQEVIDDIAQLLGLKARHIGYAGRKDKWAVTQQWLSLPLAQVRRALDEVLDLIAGAHSRNTGEWKVVHHVLHRKKCRLGVHQSNSFVIKFQSDNLPASDRIGDRLGAISKHGFPNYFMEQRFGFDNLNRLVNFSSKSKRQRLPPMLLSAGRAYLFNLLLSDALRSRDLYVAQPNDVVQLAGSQSYFVVQAEAQQSVTDRIKSHDVMVAYPLIGKDTWPDYRCHPALTSDAAQAVGKVVQKHAKDSRFRPALVYPRDLQWSISDEISDNKSLQLSFSLPTGVFATALLRELGDVQRADHSVET